MGSQSKTLKVPKPAYGTMEAIQSLLTLKGVECLPKWAQTLLKPNKPPTKGAILGISIIALALIQQGKTTDEIKRMTKEEVKDILEQGGYEIPQQWRHIGPPSYYDRLPQEEKEG